MYVMLCPSNSIPKGLLAAVMLTFAGTPDESVIFVLLFVGYTVEVFDSVQLKKAALDAGFDANAV